MPLSDFPFIPGYPKKFQRLPERVNIARLNGKRLLGQYNSYRCCEADCDWGVQGTNDKAAERHASAAHPGSGRCHVFQPIERAELIERHRAIRQQIYKRHQAKVGQADQPDGCTCRPCL